MISMHCPACGAEGRIPNDKVNVRMLCKRCLKSFHLTPAGKIVAGPPPGDHAAVHHEQPGHELDVVDHEIDVVVGRLKSAAPLILAVFGLAAAVLLGWRLTRGGKAATLDEQTVRIARALVKNDVAALRSLTVEGTADEAAELSEALLPEFRDHADVLQAASPSVEVARSPEAPGPGLSGVVASIRADQPVGRMGVAVPDVSASMTMSGSIELPLILAGDDRNGWRLDGERTLDAYRKSRTPAVPGRAARRGEPAAKASRAAEESAEAAAVPRA
ncbi:MAG: hypothetical protein BGO49_03365 [Planctomycetales bacterium 71-10]|nr:MAG: hypothetical protein BGO49_03365 [Planctomycetales bacterium 71-10]